MPGTVEYSFIGSCVDLDGDKIREMIDQAKTITRHTFLAAVGPIKDLERSLGYAKSHRQGLVMANDYHVSYFRSRYDGVICYFFTWSHIEHVFVRRIVSDGKVVKRTGQKALPGM